jgi:peptidoglycan hydrolase-like protein with peptidoglycan-binding domain
MNSMKVLQSATAISLALAISAANAANDTRTATTDPASPNAQNSSTMTGKQKATAIGATTGAVAGAVVGGPVGAVVGAGIGGYVGHEGTDANGKVASVASPDPTVRDAQDALNDKGYYAGPADGRFGPNTQGAVRRFQAERGLAQTGTLDSSTLSALGVNR